MSPEPAGACAGSAIGFSVATEVSASRDIASDTFSIIETGAMNR
jgi:hypothetical protein